MYQNYMPRKLTEKDVFGSLKRFSYSKISSFFSCARLYKRLYIYHDKSPMSKAARRGIELHNLYEKLSTLPKESEEYISALNMFKSKYPIEFMKFTNNWVPYRASLPQGEFEFFESKLEFPLKIDYGLKEIKKVWVTGRLDYINVNNPTTGIFIDYKSGSVVDSTAFKDQAAIYTLMLLTKYPNLQTVKSFIYDISDVVGRTLVDNMCFEFTRKDDKEQLELTLIKMIGEIGKSTLTNKFPASPNWKCQFCPDTTCKFNKNRKTSPPFEPQAYEQPPKKDSKATDEGVDLIQLALEATTKKAKSKPKPIKNTVSILGESKKITKEEKIKLKELRENFNSKT